MEGDDYAVLPSMTMRDFLHKQGIFPNAKYNDYQDYIEEIEQDLINRRNNLRALGMVQEGGSQKVLPNSEQSV